MANKPLTKQQLKNLLIKSTEKHNIAVVGNIGAGKTTLCKALGEMLGAKVHFESVEDNPYLENFYAEPKKYALPLQLYFLQYSMNQIEQMKKEPDMLHIQDRCPGECAKVFAPVLNQNGTLADRDYQKFLQQYGYMLKNVDKERFLYLWLDASPEICLQRVAMRGRDCEKQLSIEYLKKLDNQYQDFFSYFPNAPYLHIKVDRVDMPIEEVFEQMYIDVFFRHASPTNSPIGSHHWFNTILARLSRMGEYMQQYPLSEEIRISWGEQIGVYARHVMANYDRIIGRNKNQ